MKEVNIIGKVYGMWTVLSKSDFNKNNKIYYECLCKCGSTKIVVGANLKNGTSTNCGCFGREQNIKSATTHGQSDKTPEYQTWKNIKLRCYNPNSSGYKYYGGRGIRVCERWLNSFEAFFEDMGRRPTNNHSIERNDNDKDYSPDNCKWLLNNLQQRHTRSNVFLMHNGEKKFLIDLASEYNIPESRLRKRINSSIPVELALTLSYSEIRKYNKSRQLIPAT